MHRSCVLHQSNPFNDFALLFPSIALEQPNAPFFHSLLFWLFQHVFSLRCLLFSLFFPRMKYPSRYIDVLFRLMAVIPYLHAVRLYFNSQYRYHSLQHFEYISAWPLCKFIDTSDRGSISSISIFALALGCASCDCESSDLLTNLLNKIITHSVYVCDAKSAECNALGMRACVCECVANFSPHIPFNWIQCHCSSAANLHTNELILL